MIPTPAMLSNLKLLTSISFLLILLVFTNDMVAPMLFALLVRLFGIGSGQVGAFLFSLLGFGASGYLIFFR